MTLMEKKIRKMAHAYRKRHPYTVEELTELILKCQKTLRESQKRDFSVLEEETTVLYWYYIEDVFRSVQDIKLPPDAYFDEEDLAAAAIAKLLDAIRTYDPGAGATFRTYLRCVGKNAALHLVRENKYKFRMPWDYVKKISRYTALADEFVLKKGRVPTRQELMTSMELSEEEFRRMELFRDMEFVTNVDIDESEYTSADTCFGLSEQNVDMKLVQCRLSESMQAILEECLSEEEIRILTLRNGLEPNGRFYNIQETADIMRMSAEEVIAKELWIREKLKKNCQMRELARDYDLSA